MNGSQQGPNPLRPYYNPPAIGLKSPSYPDTPTASSAQVFGGSARDLLPDIDYTDYLDSSPSVVEWVKDTLDRAIWRYTNVLMSQPFDVAKTVLQAYAMPAGGDGQEGRQRPIRQHSDDLCDDSDYDDNVCSRVGSLRN